jgi:hypothetical protein
MPRSTTTIAAMPAPCHYLTCIIIVESQALCLKYNELDCVTRKTFSSIGRVRVLCGIRKFKSQNLAKKTNALLPRSTLRLINEVQITFPGFENHLRILSFPL